MEKAQPEVLKRIPQRAPFLFVDKIIDQEEKRIITQYHFTGEEDFYRGHFPGNPITPGVILQEAIFQSGALLMSNKGESGSLGVVSRVQDVKFKNFVRPGDCIEMEVALDEQLKNAFYMTGKTRVNGKVVMAIKFTGALVEQ
jgi:3-hydroxyacyl-[acyl-carrier-protein] dehydratase